MLNLIITNVHGREVLDSRGNPTVEAEVTIDESTVGRAIVPSGASTGSFEAVELRDGGPRYNGKGVLNAVEHINTDIKKCLLGHNAIEQPLIDHLMCELDGTENKSKLGANAMLAVSMACARACAMALDIPLYTYLGGSHSHVMPVPMMNILNGGVHAANTIDFQEFMIMPVGADSFAEGLKMGTEVYHSLKELLSMDGLSTAVGDEGGFAPDLKNAYDVLDYLMKAVNGAGYVPGRDVVFAMDAAASELYDEESGMYYFPGESQISGSEKILRTTDEMIELYEKICEKYPIKSIEDGLNEEDWEGWKKLTERLGSKIQLVGDDLFVTNTMRLGHGIKEGCGNSILVKVNQIGTLTQTLEVMRLARESGYRAIVSHRSGDTEDTSIADIAVGMNAGYIKCGAPCRSERTSKYNRLLRIEAQLAGSAVFGSSAY